MNYPWKVLMEQWNKELLEDEWVRERLPPEVLASGWLGYPGAIPAQIARAEERIKSELPKSYKQFLEYSNGWRLIDPFVYLLWSTEQVEWLSVRHREWVDLYVRGGLGTVEDSEYFVYGENQDPVLIRTEYLKTALEVSDRGDGAILLLNPQVRTPDGEWEAWFFADWHPGAVRYRSFFDMMQAQYETYHYIRQEDGSNLC